MSTIIISSDESFSSTKCTFLTRLWCRIYASFGFIISIAAIAVSCILPSAVAVTPMPERAATTGGRSRSSSVSSATTVESTTSTLVNDKETPVSATKEKNESPPPKYSRRASVSFLQSHLPRPHLPHSNTLSNIKKPVARRLRSSTMVVSKAVQETVITPASKMSAKVSIKVSTQMVPASKASAVRTARRVALISRKSAKGVMSMTGSLLRV